MSLSERAKRIKLVAFDFDGVFTDNTVYVNEQGEESVRCWRGDGIGLRKLEAAGIKAIIISAEANPVVARRAHKLGIPAHFGVQDKLECLKQQGFDLSEVAFVGNDEPDIPCLEAVGLPIVVADADIELRSEYERTDCEGGRGAVREVCEYLAGLKR